MPSAGPTRGTHQAVDAGGLMTDACITPMRVVSGIQPTGDLHLGNLLGAILRWVRMQDEAECLFFLADLHAMTVDVDPRASRQRPRDGRGADRQRDRPAKSVLFAQSAVPAHAELAWILSAPPGRLAQPDDPVQGKVGQEPRRRRGRPLHLPGAPGRRHPALPARPTSRSARTRSSMSS